MLASNCCNRKKVLISIKIDGDSASTYVLLLIYVYFLTFAPLFTNTVYIFLISFYLIRSSPSVLEYHTFITLTRTYNAVDELNLYNKLKGLLRAALGNTVYMAQLPGKTPVTTFRTMALQSTSKLFNFLISYSFTDLTDRYA